MEMTSEMKSEGQVEIELEGWDGALLEKGV